MLYLFTLWLMIVGHCVGDYVLQTDFLAKAKSPKFWEGTNDKTGWSPVLTAHSVIWTACVMAPLLLVVWPEIGVPFIVCFMANIWAHCLIDYLKCIGKSNMILDQLLHVAQITATFAVVTLVR